MTQNINTIEAKLRKRVEKAVDAKLSAWYKTAFPILKPEHHTVYIDLSKLGEHSKVSLNTLLNEIVKQRAPALYEAAGDKEVKDFLHKIDSMQDQLDDIYNELAAKN